MLDLTSHLAVLQRCIRFVQTRDLLRQGSGCAWLVSVETDPDPLRSGACCAEWSEILGKLPPPR